MSGEEIVWVKEDIYQIICIEHKLIFIPTVLIGSFASYSILYLIMVTFHAFIHSFEFSSVQFSRSVMSNSLQPHELQYARPPCPSSTLGVHWNSLHWIGDAIQPSHPLSSPSLPVPNPSQHQSLFQWVNSLHEVAKVLEFQLQHQSFKWTPRTDLL